MKMKRYFATDTRQALKELRDDQGPDAVILSNRKVDGGVEIIAALDYEDALDNSALGSPHQYDKQSGFDIAAAEASGSRHVEMQPSETVSQAPLSSSGGDDALDTIHSELKGLRSIMEAPMMQLAWGEMSRVQPKHAKLLKQLMELGLSPQLCEVLARQVAGKGEQQDNWMKALRMLANIVPVEDAGLIDTGGTAAMVGPTGVGKTTTIAKLAARFALRHGRRNVRLITTDSYRIAAHEQLRTYGRILGVPVQVATDAAELRNALASIPDVQGSPQLTLIDTAGIGQSDSRLSEQLGTLDVNDVEIDRYLVLSATAQRNLQHGVVRAFSQADLKGCILTKTDEAASLGEVLSVMVQHRLPLTYICDGQKVPDDLHRARGKMLVKEAVKLMKKAQQVPSAEELAFTFGGIMGRTVHV